MKFLYILFFHGDFFLLYHIIKATGIIQNFSLFKRVVPFDNSFDDSVYNGIFFDYLLKISQEIELLAFFKVLFTFVSGSMEPGKTS